MDQINDKDLMRLRLFLRRRDRDKYLLHSCFTCFTWSFNRSLIGPNLSSNIWSRARQCDLIIFLNRLYVFYGITVTVRSQTECTVLVHLVLNIYSLVTGHFFCEKKYSSYSFWCWTNKWMEQTAIKPM